MEIEYIYPDPNDDKDIRKQIKAIERQNTLGCLTSLLVLFIVLFVFLSLLPFMLAVLGWSILFLSVYVLYKAYLEAYILNFIEWLKSKR
ncbi:MAG: hypothetical protein J6B00_04460 [Alphaproteobacteria bacterium]|nr:hypothetical protein [Alphaproteobacteria bacterium]MBO5441373.1 hypothetical protein [Alphaproteobacteria bacterium]MBP3688061.1 hypothetical protein [Alphaproteobacteria bacterium]